MEAFLDACVLFDDLAMLGLRSRAVLAQCRSGNVGIVIPEVVVLEVVNLARERIHSAANRITGGIERLAGLGLDAGADIQNVELLARRFETDLRERLTESGVRIPSIPDTDHAILVERSIAGRKPFRCSGVGYRDALIWQNVLDTAASGDVALVTANTRDFANATGSALHPDLVGDLDSIGTRSTASLYTSLDDFIAAHIPPSKVALQHARDLLATNHHFAADLRERITKSLAEFRSWPYHSNVTIVEAEGASMRGEESPGSTDIDEVRLIGNIECRQAVSLADEEEKFALQIIARAEVLFNLVFDPPSVEWLVERRSNVDFYDHSESYSAGYVTRYIVAELDASFDRTGEAIDELELRAVDNLPEDDATPIG
jgi:hypothetical protein